MRSVKPWRSFSEQLQTLKNRGLQVEDEEAALRYLARIGYYRLSGYWYPMRVIDKVASEREKRPVRLDQFIDGSRFEDVVKLYIFDAKLRLLALDALERIELAVRVDVAHLLGKYDSCAHQNPDYLHGNFTKKTLKRGPNSGKTEHQIWLEKYQQQLNRLRREPFVEHHKKYYKGELPIWAAIEVWDFGLLSKLFAGMQFNDQKIIADKYGAEGGKAFSSWLRSLNFIRNVSAHHSRLWNINVLELAPIPKKWPNMPNNKPFLYFCFMRQLLRTICPHSQWAERFKGLLLQEFPNIPSSATSLADFGLIEGWEKWEIWQQK